jgi:3-phenylpropionate/cinnamic acid dioxygenase small subunit
LSTIDRDTVAALNELAVRYARHVDRREFASLAEVLSADACIAVFPGDPASHEALYRLEGLANIRQGFQLLHRYQRTFHLIGQQLLLCVTDDGASGETYCVASHFHHKHGVDHCFVMYIRYQDRFARVDGKWRIKERQLIVDRTTGEDVDA